MNNSDLYDQLGVEKNASQEEIKKAYRKLSKKYHPDINKEPGADDRYKEVQDAYATLGDEQKRAMYDQYGTTDGNAGGNPFGGGGFQGNGQFSGDINDILSQMFGQAFDPNRPRQGEDLQYRVQLTFEEAAFGTEKTIKYRRQGEDKPHAVEVTIPAGVEDGQQMRLDGQGDAGFNGGPNGDLYVLFRVEPSPEGFVREGANVWYEQPISFSTAALGGAVKVPTLHGEVELTIPAGSQSGTDFRLKGKGAGRLHREGQFGDEMVKIQIEVPKHLNAKQREALEAYQTLTEQNEHKKGLFK